jgi:hypothetical protein
MEPARSRPMPLPPRFSSDGEDGLASAAVTSKRTLAYLAVGKLLWRGSKNAFTLPIRLSP